MTRIRTAVLAAVTALSLASPAMANEKLTIDQAVDLALKQNYRLRATKERAAGGHDQALSAGARMLPSIHLSDEYQHWNCAAGLTFVAFAAGPKCINDLAPVDTTMLGLPPALASAFASPITMRGQDTNTFAATATQPLLGLLHTGFDFAAANDQAKAGDAGIKVSQAATIQAVRTAYLQAFEARALEQIAVASIEELEEQVKVSQARLKAGVITNADLLRVQVAEANARQQQITAHTQGEVTQAQLLDALGLDVDQQIELEEPTALLAEAGALPDEHSAVDEAISKRPELQQVKLEAKAARHNRTARYMSLLPEADLEGGYVNTYGQLFAPANQWYVGIRASWTIWEWGATFFQARNASHQMRAAQLDLENEKRGVAVEVHNARAQTAAAAAAVEVAQTAIASAQEAYRVEQALVQAGSATTTDLLDAQSALTTARLNFARSRYDLAIQHVALRRALGQ